MRRIKTLLQTSDLEALTVYSQALNLKAELPVEFSEGLDAALQNMNFPEAARLCESMLKKFDK